MPQSPNQVNPALNPSNSPTPLRVDESGALITTQNSPDVDISVVQTLGTIASTGVFQAAMAANAARLVGGAVSNHGAASMLLSFGTGAAGRGVVIAAGGSVFLNDIFPNEPYVGAINITGTGTQTFTTTEVSAA